MGGYAKTVHWIKDKVIWGDKTGRVGCLYRIKMEGHYFLTFPKMESPIKAEVKLVKGDIILLTFSP
jgi:hypothetical protein